MAVHGDAGAGGGQRAEQRVVDVAIDALRHALAHKGIVEAVERVGALARDIATSRYGNFRRTSSTQGRACRIGPE